MKTSKLLLYLICLFGLTCGVSIQAKKVTYKVKTEKKTAKKAISEGEIIDFSNAHIRADRESLYRSVSFTGYDKQLSASKESFFVINNSKDWISGFTVQIDYRSLSGEQLHQRTQTVNQPIPPGQTRKIDIPSWDSQNSFYYRLSTEPRHSAIPYDISFSLQSLTIR